MDVVSHNYNLIGTGTNRSSNLQWVKCSNCSYWTERQKANNPCTVCRNKRGKTVKGDYIPQSVQKRESKVKIGGWNGTNESGFSALPGGYRTHDGVYFDGNQYALYWTSSSHSNNGVYYQLTPMDKLYIGAQRINFGLSCRCVKD